MKGKANLRGGEYLGKGKGVTLCRGGTRANKLSFFKKAGFIYLVSIFWLARVQGVLSLSLSSLSLPLTRPPPTPKPLKVVG